MVIVGPSGSGKSTVWRLLKSAMNKMGQVVNDYTMNPKAMPRTQVREGRGGEGRGGEGRGGEGRGGEGRGGREGGREGGEGRGGEGREGRY